MLLPLLLLPIFAGLFWFVVVMPQRRINEAHRAVVASVRVGDEVVTASGLYGRVVELDETIAHLEVAPGTVLRLDRQAVALVLRDQDRAGTGEPVEGEA